MISMPLYRLLEECSLNEAVAAALHKPLRRITQHAPGRPLTQALAAGLVAHAQQRVGTRAAVSGYVITRKGRRQFAGARA